MKEQTIAVSISLGYLSYISMRIDTVYKIRRKYKGALEIQRNSVQNKFILGLDLWASSNLINSVLN